MVWIFLSSQKVISFASSLHVAHVKGHFLRSSPHRGTLHDSCHPNKNNTSYLMSVCSLSGIVPWILQMLSHFLSSTTVIPPALTNGNWDRDVTSSKSRLFVNGKKKKGGDANLCCVCLRLWPLHHLPSCLQSFHIFRNYMPQNLMNLPWFWWGR